MTTADVAEQFGPGGWEFTPEVVETFDLHVRQSVPFYDAIQETVAQLSDWLAPDRSTIVDLGASTGETIHQICHRHPDRTFRLTLYDTSEAMLKTARGKINRPMTCYTRSIAEGLTHATADLTLALFTLQFIEPAQRAKVLKEANARTARGGAILVAEKVRIEETRWQECATELSWDHKVDSGISNDAIRAKARALRGVLRPLTQAELTADLSYAGWQNVTCIFRWYQWCLFGAFA